MVRQLIVACSLMAVCVAIHATGVTWAMRRLSARPTAQRFWSSLRLFIGVAVWIVLLHLLEIVAWAWLYVSNGAIADLQTAVYFSAVTYTTTGYGDVVLPAKWRLDGGVEALTGILMCGWSTAFFFAIVSRLTAAEDGTSA